MYDRHSQTSLEELLREFRVVYLTGPRQSGKTTLARAVAEKAGMNYITLDDQTVLATILTDPHGFVRSLGNRSIVLDEFQYAPALIPAIKEASDRLAPGEKGKFLLTGSTDIFRSARVQEALPGHLARLELYPLSIAEIRGHPRNIIDYIVTGEFQSFTTPFITREQLAAWLLHGGYPEVIDKSARGRQVWFKSYMEGRLYKDFETLYAARGDYHSRLRAMAPYLAGLSGNLLKYAKLANELELNDKLAKNYVEILELMFIIHRLPVWLKNRTKRMAVRMPKIHFVDTGLACHLLGLRNERQLLQSHYYGGLLESMVYMECVKHASWAREDIHLHHFRNNRKHEVDIVLERDNTNIIGIEVKASSSINAHDFKGLATLAELAGRQFERGILFYTGQEILPFRYQGRGFHALPLGLLLSATL